MNAQQVAYGPKTMNQFIADTLAARRFSMILLGAFAALALAARQRGPLRRHLVPRRPAHPGNGDPHGARRRPRQCFGLGAEARRHSGRHRRRCGHRCGPNRHTTDGQHFRGKILDHLRRSSLGSGDHDRGHRRSDVRRAAGLLCAGSSRGVCRPDAGPAGRNRRNNAQAQSRCGSGSSASSA